MMVSVSRLCPEVNVLENVPPEYENCLLAEIKQSGVIDGDKKTAPSSLTVLVLESISTDAVLELGFIIPNTGVLKSETVGTVLVLKAFQLTAPTIEEETSFSVSVPEATETTGLLGSSVISAGTGVAGGAATGPALS